MNTNLCHVYRVYKIDYYSITLQNSICVHFLYHDTRILSRRELQIYVSQTQKKGVISGRKEALASFRPETLGNY